MSEKLVTCFMYVNEVEGGRGGETCAIVARAGVDMIYGVPMFTIRFDDGERREAVMDQLHPWFSTS